MVLPKQQCQISSRQKPLKRRFPGTRTFFGFRAASAALCAAFLRVRVDEGRVPRGKLVRGITFWRFFAYYSN